jgi:NAD-dependent histone deacetylase SIR2
MAGVSSNGQVVVQASVSAGVVDLTSSDPAGAGASNGTKPAAGTSTAHPKEEDDEDDMGDADSLYGDILDEVEAFEYSTDGRSSLLVEYVI